MIKFLMASFTTLLLMTGGLMVHAGAPVNYDYRNNFTSPPVTMGGSLMVGQNFHTTFSGHIKFDRTCVFIPQVLDCAVVAAVQFSQTAGYSDLDLEFQNISLYPLYPSPPVLTCSTISFPTSWSASFPHGSLPTSATDMAPVPFTVSGVTVNTPCGNCAGTLSGTYTNDNNGEFNLSGTLPGSLGSCSVSISSSQPILNGEWAIWH